MTPKTRSQVVASPWDYFETPAALMASELTQSEKKRALESWELDARLRMTATAENMGGGPDNDLRAITNCLQRLEGGLS